MNTLSTHAIDFFQFALQPVNVLSQGADEEKAETARVSSFVGAIAIGDLVKSTLGPKGMDKILMTSETFEVTNDGATILKSIGVDNPAAKILVEMSKAQDDEVGDGTTSVTVLASELLREGELLITSKLHPQTVVAGWREASRIALEALEQSANNHAGNMAELHNDEVFKAQLLKIARTTLSSKLLTHHKEHFANLAVNAVLRLKGSGSLDAIQVIEALLLRFLQSNSTFFCIVSIVRVDSTQLIE
ncbi:unnamed protein product [Dibothriocephalus latus]|uniref:Uncharacterized protein n=1 Tax=Dibothriocephalus latus TaxID=60516 RepID=A0A3P7LLA6_DIBLA|nr:unnamed protein product [Dibothriocephalus latus]